MPPQLRELGDREGIGNTASSYRSVVSPSRAIYTEGVKISAGDASSAGSKPATENAIELPQTELLDEIPISMLARRAS